MKPYGKPWDNLNQKEKIEVLHKAQGQTRRAINRLYRLVYPELDSKKTKKDAPQSQRVLWKEGV